jgi:hypothetical protein
VPIGLLCLALIAPIGVISAASGSLPPVGQRSYHDVRRLDETIAAIFSVQPLLVATIIVGAKGFRPLAATAGIAELVIAALLSVFSVFHLNPP